jgi:protein-tyrosine phosphatase
VWLIRERIYLGDYRSGEQALSGAEYPVDPEGYSAPFAGVISLCPMPLVPGSNLDEPASPSTEWLLIPIQDGGNGEREFEAALGVALPFLRRRLKNGNVLIHCAAGMSRSVSLVAAFLCEDGALVDQAYRMIAVAKAVALRASELDADALIAPAAEFKSYLKRRYLRS